MRQFLKYELKNNWKSFLFTYLVIIGAFILLSIFILIEKSNIESSEFGIILFMNLMFLVGGAMIMGAILFSINLVKSFYNSIYSDEGYLTLSFPKTTHSLLLSKIIINFLWVIGLFISVIIGIIIVGIVGSGSVNSLFDSLYDIINYAENSLYLLPFHILSGLIAIALSFVLMLLSFTLINMGGIKKAKLVLGLLIYMGLIYALSVTKIFTGYLSFGLAISSESEIIFAFGRVGSDIFRSFGADSYALNITDLIINIGLTLGLYFLTVNLFENKLEME